MFFYQAINIISIIMFTNILFVIGLMGVILNRKNALIIIMSIEILFLAVNVNFTAFSIYLDDVMGHVIVLFTLAVAAAESAIGLCLITTIHRLKGSISTDTIKTKFRM